MTVRKIIMTLTALICLLALAVPSFADVSRTTDGNDLVIRDSADLFTDSEEKSLTGDMTDLCQYGDTIVCTLAQNDDSVENAADNILREYGNDGLVFLIDMDNREIYLYTTYDSLTEGHCYSITDNVYEYASDGDYYKCAEEALSESDQVLQGQHIAQPMKYASNALLAVIIAMIIGFIWMSFTSRKRKASAAEIAGSTRSDMHVSDTNLMVIGTHIVHHDHDSGGGGGGGGGGHGGGHSF